MAEGSIVGELVGDQINQDAMLRLIYTREVAA